MVKFAGGNLKSVYAADKGICHLCRHRVPRSEASRDHVDPRSRGGYDKATNYRLAHKLCNHAKGPTPQVVVDRVLAEARAAAVKPLTQHQVVELLRATSKEYAREITALKTIPTSYGARRRLPSDPPR